MALANTDVVEDGVTYLKPFVAPWGEKGSPKDALWHGLALQFEPFAAKRSVDARETVTRDSA